MQIVNLTPCYTKYDLVEKGRPVPREQEGVGLVARVFASAHSWLASSHLCWLVRDMFQRANGGTPTWPTPYPSTLSVWGSRPQTRHWRRRSAYGRRHQAFWPSKRCQRDNPLTSTSGSNQAFIQAVNDPSTARTESWLTLTTRNSGEMYILTMRSAGVSTREVGESFRVFYVVAKISRRYSMSEQQFMI